MFDVLVVAVAVAVAVACHTAWCYVVGLVTLWWGKKIMGSVVLFGFVDRKELV